MGFGIEVDAREVGLSPERLARIDNLVRRYVDSGLLTGGLLTVTRRSKVAHVFAYGMSDLNARRPMTVDTIVRLYSMTKPVTSVAAMMLYEHGLFGLDDAVSSVLPRFATTPVWAGGTRETPVLESQRRPMEISHLFTHTSGLTYGFQLAHPIDSMYRRAGFGLAVRQGLHLAEACDELATFPLLFQPGSEWNYSMSTDVLGRMVEVLSGQPLDVFFREQIFRPLGMADTGFAVAPDQVHRLAALNVPERGTRIARQLPARPGAATKLPSFLSGGGGLYGTVADYHRFTQMLLRGGELDGVRLLSPRTVALMTQNHLPGGADMTTMGRTSLPDLLQPGAGFGLGFAVVTDQAASKLPNAVGTYSWGGAASTFFFIDPNEEMTLIFLTQLLPSSTHPIRRQLRQLAGQAIVA